MLLAPDTSTIAIDVISVETDGTGCGRSVSAYRLVAAAASCVGRLSRERRAYTTPLSSVRSALISCRPLSSSRKPAAVLADTEHLAGRFGAGDQIAAAVEDQAERVRRLRLVERLALAVARDAVDDALLPRGRIDDAGRVDDQRPDVLVIGVEEDGGDPLRIHTVDFPVGRGAYIQAAARRERERMDLELRCIEEDGALCRPART